MRSFGIGDRLNHQAVIEFAYLNWLVDYSTIGTDVLHQWQHLGLNPNRLYPALIRLSSSDAKALVMFSLSTEFHAEDLWFAILRINHVTTFGGNSAQSELFDAAQHDGNALEVVVAPRSIGWSMTLNGSHAIDVLGPELADAISAIVATLNHRAESQGSFTQCA